MLEAEGLTKEYRTPQGQVRALVDVSLGLAPGERLGLVGRSGSGKSTLAQVLAMLLPPDRGRLAVDGRAVPGWRLRAPAELRRAVQLVWQSPRLATDPRLRLREIILEPLAAAGLLPRDRRARADLLARWTERVGLTGELLERYPHEVSDGQLQRACLARALILQPRYLICDEISSMLDVSTQAALLRIIAEEQEARPLGVLLISHDRTLVRHWCTRVVELADGRLAVPAGSGRAATPDNEDQEVNR
ncbi:MAG TPA: dipeptide/oligopeptide/nickel ABC transporter ATP-binding protein [Dehalococcoidia bacterium]